MKTIFFYTSNSKNFRSTLLGYLLQLQKIESIQIILLTETFDDNLNDFINDKRYFPNIIRIVKVGQYDSKLSLNLTILNNICLDLFRDFKPDILFVSSDFHSIFELLICRYAKKYNSSIFSIACSNTISNMSTTAKWIRRYTSDFNYSFLPKFLAYSIIYTKNFLSHLLVYIFSPISIGMTPFFGYSSYLLMRGQSGMRDATYQIVYSKKEKANFIASGVNESKIIIIRHPYFDLFSNTVLFNFFNSSQLNIDFLIVHPAELIGYNNDMSLINSDVRVKSNSKLLSIVHSLFPSSSIYIKIHPDVSREVFDYLINVYSHISDNIFFCDPKLDIESYILSSKVIIDFPRSGSTSIFLSSVINPQILKISADVFGEFWGDNYKDDKCVSYVGNINEFYDTLINYKTYGHSSSYSYGFDNFDFIDLKDFFMTNP